MITLLGRANSGNVQYVAWALAELGQPFERIDVGGAFGGTDGDYARMNPNRLVPTLKDGDLTLWESAAIVRYLGARYGSEAFWPADPARRAPLDQWAEWIKTSFAQVLLPELFLQLVRTREADRNQAAIDSASGRMKNLASMLDARLADTTFLGGNDISFADIMVGTPLYRYFTLDFVRADTPNLTAYYERLQQRPAYREHVMVSYESLRVR
ncbi:MAG: glutathione S-transferase family protein [Mesorhizobium sp.]|nr:glutathione S-transferase family protein [Mesorhizobium sp.]